MADVDATCAEKSLDDFFAKRDKKKKKDKGKVKDQPEQAGIFRKTRKEREKIESQETHAQRDDAEWKEFELKEVDYSGLRLQALQMSDERDEEEYEKEEVGEDGEIILVSGDRVSGPWNKTGSLPAAAPIEEDEVPEQKVGGVYRPPGARLTSSRKGPSKAPPEIFSDAQFPSLAATAKHVETRKDREMEKTFEVVKYRNRAREDGSVASAQELQLENQFAVLGDK